MFSLQLYINNRASILLLQVRLLLEDKGHNYEFTASRLDNSDFNSVDIFCLDIFILILLSHCMDVIISS